MIARRIALEPLAFGRRRPFIVDEPAAPGTRLSDDLKLFALTYCAGFVFVSIFLA